jgi:hypothetical protein
MPLGVATAVGAWRSNPARAPVAQDRQGPAVVFREPLRASRYTARRR